MFKLSVRWNGLYLEAEFIGRCNLKNTCLEAHFYKNFTAALEAGTNERLFLRVLFDLQIKINFEYLIKIFAFKLIFTHDLKP